MMSNENLQVSNTHLLADIKEINIGNLMLGPIYVQQCSNCKSRFTLYVASTGFETLHTPNYCPACGARTTKPNETIDLLRAENDNSEVKC